MPKQDLSRYVIEVMSRNTREWVYFDSGYSPSRREFIRGKGSTAHGQSLQYRVRKALPGEKF